MARMIKAPEGKEVWEFTLDASATVAGCIVATGLFISPDAPAHAQPIGMLAVAGTTAAVWKFMRTWVAFKS